ILDGDFHGVVLAPSFVDEARKFTAACELKKLPYVFINSDIPDTKGLAYIGPNLLKSGQLAGQLVRFGLKNGEVLVVNISKEIDAYHHLLRKEEGFRAYINATNTEGSCIQIKKIDITNTTDKAVGEALQQCLQQHPDIAAFFVTNSRVRNVAKYLGKQSAVQHILIGYDPITENVAYLKDGTIDFLIG